MEFFTQNELVDILHASAFVFIFFKFIFQSYFLVLMSIICSFIAFIIDHR